MKEKSNNNFKAKNKKNNNAVDSFKKYPSANSNKKTEDSVKDFKLYNEETEDDEE